MTDQRDPQVAEAVLRYISGARWFAGKGRRAVLRSVTPLPWLTEMSDFGGASTEPAVRMEIAEIGYAPAEHDGPAPKPPTTATRTRSWSSRSRNRSPRGRTSTTSSSCPTGRRPTTTCTTPRSPGRPTLTWDRWSRTTRRRTRTRCRVIVRSLLSGRRLRSPDNEVRFCPTRTEDLTTSLEPRVYTGQQSNTSVMLGDAAILKLFRRLELGRNLDIEVHAALNAAQIDDVARLYGWIEGGWVSGGRHHDTDLGMVVQKLADAEDGWGLALDRLRQQQSFAQDARALGEALAETHEALRAAFPHGAGARSTDGLGDDGPAGDRRRGRAGAARPSRGPGGLFRCSRSRDPGHPAGARRLPSRPDPAHPGRVEDHRLRG